MAGASQAPTVAESQVIRAPPAQPPGPLVLALQRAATEPAGGAAAAGDPPADVAPHGEPAAADCLLGTPANKQVRDPR